MTVKIHHAIVGTLLLGGCSLSEDHFDELEATAPVDDTDSPTSTAAEPASDIAGENGAQPYAGPLIPDECIGAPVVAILSEPTGSCDIRDLPSNWIWTPMFETGSPEVAALTEPVPTELQRYCLYEYVGQEPLLDDGQYADILQAIDEEPNIELGTVAADCMGFYAQGDLNDPSVTSALIQSFMINIDALTDADLESTEIYQSPVALAVLDSVSQSAIDQHLTPHNQHGIYMSSLIREIACPTGNGSCSDRIYNLLAMPRADYQYPDWTIGEDYASKVDLAIQIYAAVQRWREDKLSGDPNAPDRLILNISLGYDRVNAGIDDFSRGPQASLKAALDFAACHGALVFAAAGNLRDENCPDNEVGPLAPAAFEELPAPSLSECATLGFVPDWDQDFPVFADPLDPRPLVYAVAGVHADDSFLVNGRLGSRPQLAALGANGLGENAALSLTGSSVSTAVASATAMLLWMYDPTLAPHDVYRHMYESGYLTGDMADIGLNGGGEAIRRLSVCAALDSLCAGLPAEYCPQLGCTASAPAADGNLGGVFAAIDAVLDDEATKILDFGSSSNTPVCSGTLDTELVTPQPELPVCGHCTSKIASGSAYEDDYIYMSIEPSYKGSIQDATLVIEDATGNPTLVLFEPGTITALNDLGVDVVAVAFEGPNTAAATLTFDLGLGETQSNPVSVRQG